jgi:hypothetical protein
MEDQETRRKIIREWMAPIGDFFQKTEKRSDHKRLDLAALGRRRVFSLGRTMRDRETDVMAAV